MRCLIENNLSLVLLQEHSRYTGEEFCLQGLIAPVTLLAVFTNFSPTLGSQLILQSVSLILILTLFSFSGVASECSSLAFWVDIFGLLSTVYNGLALSHVQELNFRRSFVLQCAATHAKLQSEVALNHLFPEPIVTKLVRDLEVPFTEHSGDLLILQSDLVGYVLSSRRILMHYAIFFFRYCPDSLGSVRD